MGGYGRGVGVGLGSANIWMVEGDAGLSSSVRMFFFF